jgi:hypothetical protein
MRTHLPLSTLVLAVLITILPAALGAQELAPEQDVYVNSEHPGTNYAGTAELFLGKGTFWGLGYWRNYFIFDVSSLAGPIESAELWIYQYDTGEAAGGLPCDAHEVTAPWDESVITWATMPSHNPLVLDSEDVGDSFYVGWIVWNITPLVQAWIDQTTPNNGVVLKHYNESPAGASRYGLFHSVESNVTDLRPKLVVVPAATAVEASTWGSLKALYR